MDEADRSGLDGRRGVSAPPFRRERRSGRIGRGGCDGESGREGGPSGCGRRARSGRFGGVLGADMFSRRVC